MSRDAPFTPPPRGAFPENAPAAAADPRIARAEERLAMLRELADLGMALARELTRRTLEAPDAPEPDPEADPKTTPRPAPGRRLDPADAFARLSRAVRLTLALEAKAEEDLAALRAGPKTSAAEGFHAANDDGYEDEDDDDDLLTDHPSAYRNEVRDAVHEVINREVEELIPAQQMLDTLYARLTEGERYDAFVHRPLKEAVAAICKDLGLHPDWSAWTDEGWTPHPEGTHCWPQMWGPVRYNIRPHLEHGSAVRAAPRWRPPRQ